MTNRGYIRATKTSLSVADQHSRLIEAGVGERVIYTDDLIANPIKHATVDGLPQREALVRDIRPGAAVVVCSLAILGTSVADSADAVAEILANGSAILDLETGERYEGIDAGKLLARIVDALAAAEGKRRRQRTAAASQAEFKGKRGAELKLSPAQMAQMREDFRGRAQNWLSVPKIAERYGVSVSTVHRICGEKK